MHVQTLIKAEQIQNFLTHYLNGIVLSYPKEESEEEVIISQKKEEEVIELLTHRIVDQSKVPILN